MITLLCALALAFADDAEAIEKFKADIKGKDGTARAAAVGELAKTKSPKICAKLATLLTGEVTEVRIAAAKGLSEQDDKKHAVAYLLAAIPANAKDPVILAPFLTAIGKLGQESGAPEVNKHIADEEVEVAKASVEAAGEIKSPTSFDPLIKELKNCEELLKPRDKNNPGGGFGGRFGGPGRIGGNGQSFREMRDRAQTLKAEIQKVLVSMAKVNCQDAQDWENWWKEHRGSYRTEKP